MKNLGAIKLTKKLSAFLALCALAVASVWIGQGLTSAQSSELPIGNGFRVSPVRQELTIEKGQSATFEVTVENPTNADVKAEPIINNFLPSDDESGSPRLILDERVLPPANDFKKLVLPLENITVPAKGEVTVPVTLSIPDDARSGGYYGAVRFVPLLPQGEGQNVALTASVGTIVLLQVPGDLNLRLDLVQLSAAQNGTPRGFFIGGDVQIATRLKNSGDIHVQPFGKVHVTDMFGRSVYGYEFNNTDPRANILPDSTRKFLDELPVKSLFGRYTITANLGYSQGGGQLITQSTSFWYFSTIALYAIIFLVLVFVGSGYWLYRKKFSKKRR